MVQWGSIKLPFWWKGNYSPLPQQLPQCFRDHSASFRNAHFTYNPSASFRDLVFLIFASATTARLRFPTILVVVGFISFHFGLLGLHLLSFWPFGPSFPFVFSFWAFISFHFGLFLFVCLGLGHFLRAAAGSSTVVWVCFPSAVLPRSFRAASAKHQSNTGK